MVAPDGAARVTELVASLLGPSGCDLLASKASRMMQVQQGQGQGQGQAQGTEESNDVLHRAAEGLPQGKELDIIDSESGAHPLRRIRDSAKKAKTAATETARIAAAAEKAEAERVSGALETIAELVTAANSLKGLI